MKLKSAIRGTKALAVTMALGLTACTPGSMPGGFNPKTCMEEAPLQPQKLQILRGPRSARNIALDMQPIYCNGQVLLKLMHEAGEPVNAGTVVFRVRVEYTGEVYDVGLVTTEISSQEFLRRVSAMILEADFTPWQRHEEDTEFIYPLSFTCWWNPDECVAGSPRRRN